MTEDEMVRWHHQFNRHEFEQILGDSEGQGGLSVLQSMGFQGVRRDSVTEQQQQNLIIIDLITQYSSNTISSVQFSPSV